MIKKVFICLTGMIFVSMLITAWSIFSTDSIASAVVMPTRVATIDVPIEWNDGKTNTPAGKGGAFDDNAVPNDYSAPPNSYKVPDADYDYRTVTLPNARASSCVASETRVGAVLLTITRYKYTTVNYYKDVKIYVNGVYSHTNSVFDYSVTVRDIARVIESTESCIDRVKLTKEFRCFTYATANVFMVEPRNAALGTVTNTTAWGGGARTTAACAASLSVSVSLNQNLTEYGRYKLSATGYYQVAVFTAYGASAVTAATPWVFDHIVSSNNPSTNNMYAQLTCAGANVSATQSGAFVGSWTYTETDCGPSNGNNPETYQCTEGGLPILNGLPTDNATVFRSGDTNTLSWGTPSISGNGLSAIISTKSRVSRVGTPWNEVTTLPTNNNNVQLWRNGISKFTTDEGTPWESGLNNTDWDFRANWASKSASAPTLLTPHYVYTVDWLRDTITITSVSLTGINYNITQKIVRSTADCNGIPLSINVVRSVTSQ